jgi:hypothetical protein
MDALAATRAPLRATAAGMPRLAWLGRWLALSSLALLGVIGLVVCFRRATGALAEPLSPPVLLGLGVVLAALAVLFRRSLDEVAAPAARWVVWLAPTVVLAIWVAGVSLTTTSAWGLAALVGSLLLEEGWSWGRWPPRSPTDVVRPRVAAATPPGARPLPPADDEPLEAVTQRLVRRREAGGEVIEGLVRVEFAAAQRHATAHLAICPPLARLPQCFAEQADGPAARIKVAQVLTCGVRIDLKLDQPAAEPAEVLVELVIQESDG